MTATVLIVGLTVLGILLQIGRSTNNAPADSAGTSTDANRFANAGQETVQQATMSKSQFAIQVEPSASAILITEHPQALAAHNSSAVEDTSIVQVDYPSGWKVYQNF